MVMPFFYTIPAVHDYNRKALGLFCGANREENMKTLPSDFKVVYNGKQIVCVHYPDILWRPGSASP